MKGMTLEQYGEVLKFIAKYHKFAKFNSLYEGRMEQAIEDGITPELAKHGHSIKYIRNCFDTRTMEVWSIEFGGFGNIRFATNFPWIPSEMPKGWKYDNLYDLTMAYLKGEFQPTEEFVVKY